jgi:hypothetical protein
MRKYTNYQVLRAAHPTIGHAIAAALNEFGPGVRVLCVVHHPADGDRAEFAEVIVDVGSARRRS